MPKKVKHRKWHKGSKIGKGTATRCIGLSYGSCGLKAADYGWLNSRQIEAARRAMTNYLKRGGKIWIRIFPDKPVTQKGAEMPMGKGKGAPDHFVVVVKPGTTLFEMEGVSIDTAREAMRLAGHKLPIRSKFIYKQ